MTLATTSHQESIRRAIRPFQHEVRYITGWSDPLTFHEIYDALIPNINRLMRYYRNIEADIPDMIAHGFMRLWEDLAENPDLLANIDHGGAIKYVMNRRASSVYRKWYRREMYYEEMATRSGDPDEFLIDGLGRGYHTGMRHSGFSKVIDKRIDIERAMEELANKYMDEPAHLAALYYVTTDVSLEDAAQLAGRSGSKKAWWLTSIVKPMREEIGALLGIAKPRTAVTWQDRITHNDQPMLKLMNHYQQEGDMRMVATLKNLQKGESCNALCEALNVPITTANYLRRTAHKKLNEEYGCKRQASNYMR